MMESHKKHPHTGFLSLAVLTCLLIVLLIPAIAHAGVNRWTSTGPGGGIIQTIAVDPLDADTVYIGYGGEVYKSVDAGANWVAMNNGPTAAQGVISLAVDPKIAGTLYAGASNGQVFKSTDGGASWAAMNEDLVTSRVYHLAIDPIDSMTLYAATADGVFKSIDGAASWSAINNGLPDAAITRLAIDPIVPTTLYTGGSGTGVYKSTNGGNSWSLSNGNLSGTSTILTLLVDPVNHTTVYLAVAAGVFKSTDGAGSWNRMATGLNDKFCGATQGTMGILALAIDPVDTSTLYTACDIFLSDTATSIYKSTNGTDSWVPANTGISNSDIQPNALVVAPGSPSTVYAGTNGRGLFKSSNAGQQWQSVNTGLVNAPTSALAVDPVNPATVYAADSGFNGVRKSTDGAASWLPENLSGPRTPHVALAVDPLTPSRVYAGLIPGGGVIGSLDAGATWSKFNEKLGGGLGAHSLAIDPVDTTTLYAGSNGGGVYKSIDSTDTWTEMREGMPRALDVYALAIDPLAPDTLYAGTDGGFAEDNPDGLRLFKTSDGAQSWTAMSDGLPDNDIRALAIDPDSPATLYAGTREGGVYKSTDGAMSWSAANNGLDNLDVRALAIDPLTPTTLYAGTLGGGVFRSIDGAANWREINNGLENTVVLALAIDPLTPAIVYAGTQQGVFQYEAVDTTPLSAAVLPASRSVLIGETATAFATLINSSAGAAIDCRIASYDNVLTPLSYQTTNPATNALTGTADTPVDIAPGEFQSFLISITPGATFAPRDVEFLFDCANAPPALPITGLNTLLLSASNTPVADIIALGATQSMDGIVNIPGANGTGIFSVASVNVGADADIEVSADTGDATLPLSVLLCQTDPVSGVCTNPQTPSTDPVAVSISANATPTFAFFAVGTGAVAFDPANHRIFVRFRDQDGAVRGATSVAARTQ